MKTTNNLKFTAVKTYTKNGNKYTHKVSIRLNDECNNGHEDFAITSDIRENNREYMGGCCHDEVLKHFPEFKIFVDLHLSTFKGIPMYAIANGWYFVNIEKWSVEKLANYYRLPLELATKLINCNHENLFAYIIKNECLPIWENQANEAIKLLEKLTQEKFEAKAVLRHNEFDKYDFKVIEKQIKEGYYSDENIKKRQDKKIALDNQKKLEENEEERQDKIKRVNLEHDAIKFICESGLPLNNFIFYSHVLEACFNWKSYETKITQEQFETLKSNWKIEGVKLTVKEF